MTFRVIILRQAHRTSIVTRTGGADHHSFEQPVRWSDKVYDQISTLASFPESNGLSSENDGFPYAIRDKVVGLGSRPDYRAVFTIQGQYGLCPDRPASRSEYLRPDQVDAPPEM